MPPSTLVVVLQVARLMYQSCGVQSFHGVYTIVAFWFIRSGSLTEIEDALRKLKQRFVALGVNLKCVFTNRPDQDRGVLPRV
jgi:hypothetical protein